MMQITLKRAPAGPEVPEEHAGSLIMASASMEALSECALHVIVRRTTLQRCLLNHGGMLEMGRIGQSWRTGRSVQDCWPHERNLLDTPLQTEECVCSRTDCASSMYKMFFVRRRKLVEGTGRRLEIGQPHVPHTSKQPVYNT